MAKSRFEYVRNFELPDALLPNTFVLVRVDGRGFHKSVCLSSKSNLQRQFMSDTCRFSDAHDFTKPNDVPALDLMNRAARAVMEGLPDVILAFGESDEFR
jgi:tRNA(His) guanylyltransferase